jgi:heme O synthase-like polyprenyltransferase
VVASSAAGFVAGSEEHVDWSKLAWTALGTMGAAASANTLNQVPPQNYRSRERGEARASETCCWAQSLQSCQKG